MSDYWVSQKKHHCEYCRTWVQGDAQSIKLHEQGQRHKTAVKDFHSQNRRAKAEEAANAQDIASTLAHIERAAQEASTSDKKLFYSEGGSSSSSSGSATRQQHIQHHSVVPPVPVSIAPSVAIGAGKECSNSATTTTTTTTTSSSSSSSSSTEPVSAEPAYVIDENTGLGVWQSSVPVTSATTVVDDENAKNNEKKRRRDEHDKNDGEEEAEEADLKTFDADPSKALDKLAENRRKREMTGTHHVGRDTGDNEGYGATDLLSYGSNGTKRTYKGVNLDDEGGGEEGGDGGEGNEGKGTRGATVGIPRGEAFGKSTYISSTPVVASMTTTTAATATSVPASISVQFKTRKLGSNVRLRQRDDEQPATRHTQTHR